MVLHVLIVVWERILANDQLVRKGCFLWLKVYIDEGSVPLIDFVNCLVIVEGGSSFLFSLFYALPFGACCIGPGCSGALALLVFSIFSLLCPYQNRKKKKKKRRKKKLGRDAVFQISVACAKWMEEKVNHLLCPCLGPKTCGQLS